MADPIYLDFNATTPVDPEVLEAMLPWLREQHGNPSSTHAYGRRAADPVATARAQVADLIGAQAHEIVFTGSGRDILAEAADTVAASVGSACHSASDAVSGCSPRWASMPFVLPVLYAYRWVELRHPTRWTEPLMRLFRHGMSCIRASCTPSATWRHTVH